MCWGEVLAGCCLQASRGREESEEVRGAGCSPVWWMPVSNDSEGRWLQFHEGAGRSEAEWEQVEEGLRTNERGGQEMIKKKRRSTDGRAGSTESHSDGHCLSHPLPPGGSNDQHAVPKAPRHYQSAKHLPPALVGYRCQKWGFSPWSGQWDAQEACCIGFNAKYSQGEAMSRRWPGRSFQHEYAPASTSRPHKKAAPQSTDLRGS